MIMREVEASEAQAQLSQLLDDVEQGETIVIVRHGRPVARLVPYAAMQPSEAVEAIKALRKGSGSITVEELLSARDEGRK
jgi:prevent-host-death family protein